MEKPNILIGALPIYGHTMPMRAIARGLVQLGFSVTFVTSSYYRTAIEEIGAAFQPLSGYSDFSESVLTTRFPARAALSGQNLAAYDTEHLFVRSLPSQYESVQAALQGLKANEPDRNVVLVVECGFMGILPSMLNAPGIKPDAHITIGVLPLSLSSIDTAPFGSCLPPDNSPAGRARNASLNALNLEELRDIQNTCNTLLSSVGAQTTESLYSDAAVLLPDRYIQMCVPEIEYPRSDLPSNVRFAGGLPRGSRGVSTSFPPFWDEIITTSQTKQKKIVAVSQGTFSNLPNQLLLPAISAFSESPYVLIIAILGARNASLPPEVALPSNVRVADFIPFDDILPYCDVFVTNGGYGAVQHAIANGTPMVVAGSTEEKPENAARVQWAGIGIDLRTGTPTEAMLREAVEKVLREASFKEKIMAMKESMERRDPLAVISEQIMECGGRVESKRVYS
jgi:UDP:flavonoid glycosyltransferase YjiC (YdhE family)